MKSEQPLFASPLPCRFRILLVAKVVFVFASCRFQGVFFGREYVVCSLLFGRACFFCPRLCRCVQLFRKHVDLVAQMSIPTLLASSFLLISAAT